MPKRQRDSTADTEDGETSKSRSNQSSKSQSKSQSNSHSPSSESSDTEQQNDSQSIDAEDSKTRSETLRKRQHQKSDKQRRAKIKEGMDQLKTLVSMHGKLESPDQASIVTASIDLVHSLRNEIVSLKSQIDAAQASNVQQRAAIQQFQSRMSIFNSPFQTPAHQLFSDQPLDLPIPPATKRSSSVVSNSSNAGIVSNAQFAQLSAQIQQIRPYNQNNSNNNNSGNQQQMQSPQQQSQQQHQQQYTPMQLQRLASVLGFPSQASHQGEMNSILNGSPLPQRSPSIASQISQMSHQSHQSHQQQQQQHSSYNPQNSPQAPRQPWDQ